MIGLSRWPAVANQGTQSASRRSRSSTGDGGCPEALSSESYDLVIAAERLGEPSIVALCELVQSAAFRKQLRARFGYDVSRTGELRVG
jgi:hypothetical protein